MASQTQIHVTQVRSSIGRPAKQHQTLVGIGLGRIGKKKVLQDTPAIRGMVRKVQHLITVEVHAGAAELNGKRHQK